MNCHQKIALAFTKVKGQERKIAKINLDFGLNQLEHNCDHQFDELFSKIVVAFQRSKAKSQKHKNDTLNLGF